MPSDADYAAFVEDHDLIGLLDRGDALRDDDDGARSRFFLERAAQARVGFKVEGREAIVEDIDRRFFHEGAGDRQSLLLASRYVVAAL